MTRTLPLDFSSRGMSRRPISALPAPLLAYRFGDLRAPLARYAETRMGLFECSPSP
jgi:hypothetical protein